MTSRSMLIHKLTTGTHVDSDITHNVISMRAGGSTDQNNYFYTNPLELEK